MGLRPRTQTTEEVDVDDGRAPLADWLRSAGRFRRWAPGVPIFRQGEQADALVLVRAGSVKVVSHASGGKQVMLALRGRGDVLGEFAALDGRPRSASVVALTDVDGWTVSSGELLAHLERSPAAAITLLRILVSRLREADLHRLEFGSLDTTGRIASLLGALTVEQGEGGWVRLTQTELGEAVGASREATVKALARLRRAGVVETARARVRVLRPDDLARIAENRDVVRPR